MTLKARALRNNLTDAERKLWSVLRGDRLGVRFRRQLPVDRRYIVDFCAPSLGLVIEVDGGQHADNPADTLRDAYLARRGYRVLRFWNHDVLKNLDGVVHVILEAIAAPASPPAPLRDGEGGAAASCARHDVACAPLSRGRGDGGEGLPAEQTSNGKT